MTLKIKRLTDGRLEVSGGNAQPRYVSVRSCFPWSQPGSHISLRDEDGAEVALIRDLDTVDAASRAAIEAALAEAGFVFEVEHIKAIETEFEIRNWKVMTRQGELSFQTRLDEWPRGMADGTLLLRDVAGNLIRFPVLDALDAASRKLLWAYLE